MPEVPVAEPTVRLSGYVPRSSSVASAARQNAPGRLGMMGAQPAGGPDAALTRSFSFLLFHFLFFNHFLVIILLYFILPLFPSYYTYILRGSV